MITLIGIVTYFVSTKVKPEEIRKVAIQELQKVFPKAKVDLGKIDVSLGTSINLDAEKFVITYPHKKKNIDLFSVGKLNANIPILTILLGGGSVDIRIDKPSVKYLSDKDKNLWQLAMKKDDVKKDESKKKGVDSNKGDSSSSTEAKTSAAMTIPLFIANSSINLSFHEINVEYGDVSKIAGNIDINTMFIKNLGLKKDAAYEIDSAINLPADKISLKALLIGEFSLKDFLNKGDIRSKALLTLSEINLPQSKGRFPEIRNNIELAVGKNNQVNMGLSGEFEKSSYKLKIKLDDKEMIVRDIDINLPLMDLKMMLPEPMAIMSPNKSTLKVDGSIRLKGESIYPSLNYELSDYANFNISGFPLKVIGKGLITENKITNSSMTAMFDGSIESNFLANIDLNSKNKNLDSLLKSYELKLGLNKLAFQREFLQQTLYPETGKKQAQKEPKAESGNATAKASATKDKKEASIPLLPRGKITLKAKEINLGGKNLNAGGLITTKENAVVVKNLKFLLESGEAVINNNLKMYRNKMTSNFSLKMKEINISSFDGVMPQKFSGSTGLFNGTISGNVQSAKKLGYNVAVDIKGSNGELKGIDLKPYLEKVVSLVKKIPGLDKKVDSNKKIEYNGNFKTFQLKGNFKPTHYQIKSSEFIGLDNLVEAKANGNIYPETKKEGKVFADIIERKYLSKYVETYAGTNVIPVLFKGKGMELNADYQYTVKKLSKKVLNKNKSKVKKKAKDKLKKEVDKIFKGKGKEKIDNLLKGLF